MSLQEYRNKRDPKKTKEPFTGKPSKGKPIFVVQEHWASHLHYDFRLEAFGTLKSWAVPKGPPGAVGEKRLAVEVEDHPIDYANFHGKIPEGEYGAGEVKIWDKGVWVPPSQLKKSLETGRLEFELQGKKLKGRWLLVRTKKSSGKKSQWLLIKRTDEEKKPKTPELKLKLSKKDPWPEKFTPQLALLSSVIPRGKDWIHEIKYDGYRTLAEIKDRSVHLYTRSRLDWTEKYTPLDLEFKKLGVKSAILDGEIVVLDENGKSNFALLQNALKGENPEALVFYAFDLLYLDGSDLRNQPLEIRKQLLKKVLKENKSKKIIYSEHWLAQGEELFTKACEEGLEGIISKNRHQPYRSRRTPDWQKIKCSLRQEFVIGGVTDAGVAHRNFGALLLGAYEKNKFRYVGRVGTGFDAKILSDLHKKISALETNKSPFDLASPRKASDIHWVKPKLVAEIEFKTWTGDKVLRHASFQGLREDKKALEVRIEIPVLGDSEKESTPGSKVKKSSEVEADGNSEFKITHPDRVIYENPNVSKLDVANYYRSVSGWMLNHLSGRPLSLVRCPNQAGKGCFFQKHMDRFKMSAVKEALAQDQKIIYVHSEEGLLQLVQWGVLEFHTWQTHVEHLDFADQLVFDLDPDDSVKWEQVVKCALDLKEILDDLSLRSFIKTTGGKGLHIQVPLAPIYTWDQAKSFSKTVVKHMESENSELYTTNILKSNRKGKIFLDYLRNGFSATSVVPYSLRSKNHPFVSVPIAWSELSQIKGPDAFDLTSTLKRLVQEKKDPWAQYFSLKQEIRILQK